MVGIPAPADLVLIWVPTIASVVLSFTNWNGIGGITASNFVGLKNYETLFTAYPFFWPALQHNLIWLAFLMFIATPLGIFLAVLLDREIRGTRFYQTVFYLPSSCRWRSSGSSGQLQYAPEQGFINNVLGRTAEGQPDRLAGQPRA